ncbi:tyrosine aminotransferase [Angomonas deanei]|nr:tyrosine aminotransferase [Angomonas deanei]|eukprot:EPY30512.1 tyrosine aminotransferase [Angomonas deanei]
MSDWNIRISTLSSQVYNPIRAIADSTKPSTCGKSQLTLSLGDPTLDGHLLPSEEMVQAVQEAVGSHRHDGYVPVLGTAQAKSDVVEYWKRHLTSEATKAQLLPENVALTCGGTHAISAAVAAICNPGDNIIVPAPGFPTYGTACRSYGVEIRFYKLHPERNFEADVADIEALRDDRTRMIVMTNPSNPCGSNYSRAHVQEMVEVAEKLKLPLLSDEIYAGLVFQNEANPYKEFVSVADIDSKAVRIILGGTAKLFTVPGWRVAWLLVVDPLKVAAGFLEGVTAQCTLVLGPSTLAQASLRALLTTPQSHTDRIRQTLEDSSFQLYDIINAKARRSGDGAPLLKAYTPQGAMYVMLEVVVENFDPSSPIHDDVSFYTALNEEENVLVMPGSIFGAPNFVRAVTARKKEIITEAAERMIQLVQRYEKKV